MPTFFCCKLAINFLVKAPKLTSVPVSSYVMAIASSDWRPSIIKGTHELIFSGSWDIFIFSNNTFFCKLATRLFKNLTFSSPLTKLICGTD